MRKETCDGSTTQDLGYRITKDFFKTLNLMAANALSLMVQLSINHQHDPAFDALQKKVGEIASLVFTEAGRFFIARPIDREDEPGERPRLKLIMGGKQTESISAE